MPVTLPAEANDLIDDLARPLERGRREAFLQAVAAVG
jgi:hypothetical protein